MSSSFRRVFAAVVALQAMGCSKAPVPRPAAPAPLSLTVLREACVPAGPERCGNARDDNCNGVLDEGCGIGTGLIQFMIAWDAATADVDLLVTDPRGELVEVRRKSSAGLVKDRDCPGRRKECRGNNFENVYLLGDEPKRGVYDVRVRLERLEGEEAPVTVTFGARVGPKSYSTTIELVRPEDERKLTFTL
jgi:tRNA (guanosine-2'-O-)-methyltransferase